MQNVTVELSKPLIYTGETGEVEANHVELREPTGKQSHICCDIESLIQSGIMKMSDTIDGSVIEEAREAKEAKKNKAKIDEVVEDDVITPDAALALMMSSGVDMVKITLHFRELFKQVAYMGGEKLFTTARLDSLSHKDFKKLMATYTAVFIMS